MGKEGIPPLLSWGAGWHLCKGIKHKTFNFAMFSRDGVLALMVMSVKEDLIIRNVRP